MPFYCEGDGFWSQFFLSQFWPLFSSLVLPKGREDKFEGLRKGGGVGLDDSLCVVFEILVCIGVSTCYMHPGKDSSTLLSMRPLLP